MSQAIKTGNHIHEEFQLICTKLIPTSLEYSTVVDQENKNDMWFEFFFPLRVLETIKIRVGMATVQPAGNCLNRWNIQENEQVSMTTAF